MRFSLLRGFGHERTSDFWNDTAPIREELFGIERLEQHAETLAAAQPVTKRPDAVRPLTGRLKDNAKILLMAYRASAAELERGRSVAPAAEWLLDNYHVVEEQIREIRDDLPPGYYRQLPKLAAGPFAGYPRVFGLAWAFVAHTDSHFDPETLRRFVAAYQRVQPLTIGELWAVAITLRIVLVENLRRLANQITAGQAARGEADILADRLLSSTERFNQSIELELAARSRAPLSERFACQLAKRLRDQDPRTTPGLGWLEQQLSREGTSIEEVVQHVQLRQVASNVSVRNVITSMRLISDTDWTEFFEAVSLVDAGLRADSAFADMDFPTRNLYRSGIEQLARSSGQSELEIVDQALIAARSSRDSTADSADNERVHDPGYYLIGDGRHAFEKAIGFRPSFRSLPARLNARLGIGLYVGAILALTAIIILVVIATLSEASMSILWLALLTLLGVVPAIEIATAFVNRAVSDVFGAKLLPGLELARGVPVHLCTMVVIPTLMTDEASLNADIERLEVHYLSSLGGELYFALLLDGVDAAQETMGEDDRLLALAAEGIGRLNRVHGLASSTDRFFVFHRRRVFNAGEGCWMGWERKRGKLHELNRLLRGATDTTYDGAAGRVPPGVRYVITLDADTRLPRDTARQLIGKMGHPLNRPRFDEASRRVVDGYAILQPRVIPSLPTGRDGSLYQRVFSSRGGIDPYAAAVSDVYQDLFGEGTYTGKGIYDVDAFEQALEGRIPANKLLSHDLFEGSFARAGLASDVELVEEFPARYDVASKRQHRWARGDWQLLPWIMGRESGRGKLHGVALWKMLDNLRRTLISPLTFVALVTGSALPPRAAIAWTVFILGSIAAPAFLPIPFAAVPRRSRIAPRNHLCALAADVRLALMQITLQITFLADQAWWMGDAIARTLHRIYVSRRNLLEWVTAAQAKMRPQPGLLGSFRQMIGGVGLGVLGAVALAAAPASWPVTLPFMILWMVAPAVALWVSRSPRRGDRLLLTEADARALRLTARRTWRFFESFVTPADNMLPPDNFQEDPKPVIAHRTSPTNMGLCLLSTVAARDLGWIGTLETVERLEATLAAMGKLRRFKGHFLNWYETRDLHPLEPMYVSSVDSGNLAGHLIALASSCREWADHLPKAQVQSGMADNLHLAREALANWSLHGDHRNQVASALDEIAAVLTADQPIDTQFAVLRRLTDRAAKAAEAIGLQILTDDTIDLIFWIGTLRKVVSEYRRDKRESAAPETLKGRLEAVATIARDMAMAMDFSFLLDPERKLLSIGYSIPDNKLDSNCYDLLASEARLASLFAIAKGDVPTRHWFRLGRTATPLGSGSALLSWSGSMFEYLMPSLVMRAPAGSLLEQTNRLVVKRQQAYGRSLGIPWGVSESAYNARDLEFTLQYSNFGVPGLGLKRGLAENVVIAPYATGLAAMVDPHAAVRNFARLTELGAKGRYGFYEALDFTRSRLPAGAEIAIVRNFMAHHQGMTIVAIANTLQDGRMRTRFHAEPMIQASELLLQERMPRDVAVAHPRAEEVKVAATEAGFETPAVRRLTVPAGEAPVTHLLSNGRYAIMLTSAGSGYSRWRDISITRWREDATRDDWGSYILLRDAQTGKVWSAGSQPVRTEPDSYETVFGEDRAEFIRHDGTLGTLMDVLVSAEDDAEVRRISLANGGRRRREIELTSYAEIVLASPAADNAHPAFSKMFVETEYLAEFGALIGTRRRRSPEEPEIWAAHFAVVEGELIAVPQYETDRARFLGRGRDICDAVATEGEPLSETVGTVLDPIFALRYRVAIPAGNVAQIAFWTVVASSRAELIDLVDKHHDRNAYDRAKTLAWTQAQVQLRHLDVRADEAADFQRLAAPIIYSDPRFRPSSDAIIRGAGGQSGLWPHGISGDRPIVLCRIDDIEDIDQVRQLLRAHEYWRMKRLGVDIVIINERPSSYAHDLQTAIETAVRTSQARPHFSEEWAQGAAYVLRADLMTMAARALLESVARVVLVARRGSIADQIAGWLLPMPKAKRASRAPPSPLLSIPTFQQPTLEFFNGLGGFDKDGREYVTILKGGASTPAPWINVIANSGFGFQVAAEGSSYTWCANSRENQLTPWSNDPVCDPPGEAIFVRDEDSGDLWSPTAQPIRDGGTYIARHGRGYSRFEHTAQAIELELTQFVPLTDPVKIGRLRLHNLSSRVRRLSVTGYVEWVLGASRNAAASHIITEIDTESGAILARNPWNIAFGERIAFADLCGRQTSWTADRTEFIGRNGSLSDPAALTGKTPLAGRTGAGLDPCAALQAAIVLTPGETVEIVFVLGQTGSLEEARTLIARYREADLDAVLAKVEGFWEEVLGAIEVRTPDRAMDIMLNGWLLYQTLSCRIWARSAFYQASGAYGFRDQLQDGMALTFVRPEMTRDHLLRAAARQFVEGDVQHWWLPHSGQGVRTRISDDRVWLAYCVATYIEATEDVAILDEIVPFLDGPGLKPGEHDIFFQPAAAEESASLFEHCARGLDQCLALTSERGLPLIGTGDWNDGMNRVGEAGRGDSVWLGWFLLRSIDLFATYADKRDSERAKRWREHAASVRGALEREAWDGEWYRRGTFDDGTPLGSAASEECRIDSIAQSWAVLSGAADPLRGAQAMASMDQRLIRRADGLALLFTPPFDRSAVDPGYIKGYPPGLRENGGQYSHAAMWSVLAFAKLGMGDRAGELFSLLNPINHARTPEETIRYKVEPYVVAADVYSVPPHTGRGGWTWYTGSAAWMYRAGIEGILGIRCKGEFLFIDPCIPAKWQEFEATVRRGSSHYEIRVANPAGRCRGLDQAELNGKPIPLHDGCVRVPLDGGSHLLSLRIGNDVSIPAATAALLP